MACVGSVTTIDFLSGEGTETNMAEATQTTVSRRSTRLFVKDQDSAEVGTAGIAYESRYGSSSDEKEKEKEKERPARETGPPSGNVDARLVPIVDLGIDLSGMFPTTAEDMGKQVTKSIQAAKASNKSKVDGRPVNFGIVLPDMIYRSSFPMTEDFQYLGTLGLKTIVSLVDKDFPADFKAFMKANGIRHCVIEMQGTKKVQIPDAVMNSIMDVVLNKENHPLLIHCNHGKHRTGCAAAVIRHIAGWNVDQIVQEYQGFAEPKIRECDIKYITEYKVSKLVDFFSRKIRTRRSSVLTSSRMQKLLVASAAAVAVWIATGLLWGERVL